MIENIWILITIIISAFILSTDPKTPSTGNSKNTTFIDTSEQQTPLQTFIWTAVASFYVLSLVISYK